MTRKKRGDYEKAMALDMDFGEALERFAKSDPKETEAEASKAKALRLVQHEDGGASFLVYATDRGIKTELRFDGETPWFTYAQLGQIFGVDETTAIHHVQNFLDNGELDEASTTGKFPVVQLEGRVSKTREIKHFSLDVAFYVGYRVNSAQGVMFRRWVTDAMVQIAKHGSYIDKDRLMAPSAPGVVDELKETIRQIRGAPDNAYREVKRMITMCQDYDPASKAAQAFFAGMQNKMLYIASGRTAPELIAERADPDAPNMGLTYYLGKKGPTQKDSQTGDFYLDANEQRQKGRAIFMLLDYFEEQLDQGRLVTMKECEQKLDGFIEFNKWPLLRDLGSVSRDHANAIAAERRERYLALQAISDGSPSAKALPKPNEEQ